MTSTPTEAARSDTDELLREWFGTPDQPLWPSDLLAESGGDSLVSLERLEQAAGPVLSFRDGEHVGLYREHCVNCHGVEGSGAGPAAVYQAPYPRDFRAGIFKWKSTVRTSPPTRDDLRRTILHGVPGTAMPSFAQIDQDELESLIDYVIYLSVRGQVERQILLSAVTEWGYGDSAPEEPSLRLVPAEGADVELEGAAAAKEVLNEVVAKWAKSSDQVVAVPLEILVAERAIGVGSAGGEDSLSANELVEAIERGREIFHGSIANCAGCHGASGAGGIPTLDFDDWTKEYSTRLGITPTDRDALRPFLKAGAMPPRPAIPRPLFGGVARGGDSPEELYRRISQGIAGTPMPGVAISEEESPTGLSNQQVTDLIHYVRSLLDTVGGDFADGNGVGLVAETLR